MKKRAAALLASAMMLLLPLSAGASVVFDNFGAGDTYSADGYTVGSPFGVSPDFDTAAAFTATGRYTLDTIELGMTHVSGANELDIFLASDASGSPGSVLESLHLSNALPGPPNTAAPIVVASLLHPLLMSGSPYWVIASAPSAGSWLIWNFNTAGDLGSTAERIDGGAWSVFGPSVRGAMRISGTTVAAIPEPSTYALMLAGIGVVVCAARRRTRG